LAIDIAEWFYFGVKILNLSEKETWRATLKKLKLLLDVHFEFEGVKKKPGFYDPFPDAI